jgi:hypothetical protein
LVLTDDGVDRGGKAGDGILLTIQAALGPGCATVTLPAAWLALLDDDDKIKYEQVVSFAVPT